MSSDGKDSSAIWPGPLKKDRDQSGKQIQPSDQEEQPPLLHSKERVSHLGALSSVQEHVKEEINAQLAGTPFELIKQFGQYFLLVLAPLLFGGFTCLFVLPRVALGQASIPPEGIWLIAFIIIAVTIAQGIAIYYSGSNNGLRALSTIGGFFAFLLVGCLAIFGLIPGSILLVILIGISIVLARLYLHPVPEGTVDIVFAFGKYSRTLYPGLNILLPWEKATHPLHTEIVQWTCPTQRVQLSRVEDVILAATISYQLMPEDAHLAVTQTNNWEANLRELFLTSIQTIATKFSPNTFIAWPRGLRTHATTGNLEDENADNGANWEQVNVYLQQQMCDKAALWGVIIHEVHIRDVALAPHGAVAVEANFQAQEQIKEEKAASPSQISRAEADTSVSAVLPQPVTQQTTAALPSPILKEEVLIKAYKEVQSGKITDPQTIREIAANFEAIVKDPKANQTVSFDAARAAANLYEQAKMHEAQA